MAGSQEVRIFAEGSLRWVQASGTATTAFSTASAAPTGLVGFVQAGMSYTSAQRVFTVPERGEPHHHKVVGKDAPEVTFTLLESVTANDPALRVLTASGASTPMLHFELKSKAPEDASALYYQFLYCALVPNQFTEGEEGNTRQQTWRAIRMVGPTASGYMSTALA